MTILHRLLAACALACPLAVATLIGVVPAAAEKRVALVIGNSAYRNVPSLANPGNDARLMADTLRDLGFTLVGRGAQLDLDKAGLDTAVRTFGNQLQGADVGLFYYAGHGVQVRGANYLVPVNANPTREADVDYELGDLALVLRQMEASGTRLNLVILDACRNNPFGGRGLRATDPGLAQMRAPEGTLISFATQPGNVAQDGGDGNSPYTRALAQTIRQPGLGIFDAINEVGLLVKRATGGAQQPWFSTSPIDGRFFFAAPQPATAAPAPIAAPIDPCVAASDHWRSAEAIGTRAAFEDHLARFPNCMFAGLAKARIAALQSAEAEAKRKADDDRQKVAVVVPPVAPPTAPPASPSPCAGGAVTDRGQQALLSLDRLVPGLANAARQGALSSRAACPLSADEERGLKPKDSFKECDACPEMVVVPSGSFTMGWSPSRNEPSSNEGPQHQVTFARQFTVGRFAVTFEEWDACVADGGCNGYKPEDNGWGRNRRPAIKVSWDDAKAYVAWLSRKTGKTYRLLSEAEREYVTRAGTTTPFWWGSSISTQQANYDGTYTYESGAKGEDRQKTMPVDSFAPNPWGLYQVHGNVWESVEDCYHDSYAGAPSDGSAWTSGDCSRRVIRGGSWNRSPSHLRASVHNWGPSDLRDSSLGFRVARTLDQTATPASRTETPPAVQQAAVAPPAPPAKTSETAPTPAVGIFPPASSSEVNPLTPEKERSLKPRDSFKECDACPEMVVVPAGAFTMGSPAKEKDRTDDEGPQHVVTIKQPFAVGKFEVTVDQFAAFAKETGYDIGAQCEVSEGTTRKQQSWRDPGYKQDGSHPVACLKWDDAKLYVDWLAKKTGKDYRLPTEAEWEYAARARPTPGSGPRFFFGDDEKSVCSNANGFDQTAQAAIPRENSPYFMLTGPGAAANAVFPCRDGFTYTAPVGRFRPNAFGLYDMYGNVWEWTRDCYRSSYTGAPTDGSASTSGNCDARVSRGGSWNDGPRFLRSAMRSWYNPLIGGRHNGDGFRVARTLAP